MKKYFILFFILLIGLITCAQSTTQSVNFLREVFAKEQPTFYFSNISNHDLNILQQVCLKDTLKDDNFFRIQKITPQLILTKNEKNLIMYHIKQQSEFRWKENLFKNSRTIRKEENNYKSLSLLNMKTNKAIYSFSEPIFIRKNSVCIFYYGYSCGGECGQGSIEIYHKINNRWTKWISMVQWIS